MPLFKSTIKKTNIVLILYLLCILLVFIPHSHLFAQGKRLCDWTSDKPYPYGPAMAIELWAYKDIEDNESGVEIKKYRCASEIRLHQDDFVSKKIYLIWRVAKDKKSTSSEFDKNLAYNHVDGTNYIGQDYYERAVSSKEGSEVLWRHGVGMAEGTRTLEDDDYLRTFLRYRDPAITDEANWRSEVLEIYADSKAPRLDDLIKEQESESGSSDSNVDTSKPVDVSKTPAPTMTLPDLDQNVANFANPLKSETISGLIAQAIRIMLILAGSSSVLVIAISGFQLVWSSGMPDKRSKAITSITWAVVGLILSLLAFSIVAIVQRIF